MDAARGRVDRWIDRGTSLVVAAAAVALAVGYWLNQNPGSRPPAGQSGELSLDSIDNFVVPVDASRTVGHAGAQVRLTVWTDYQCPFCRRFEAVIDSFHHRSPGVLSVEYLHFPLSNHEHAHSAAKSAECAAAQGSFAAMHESLFHMQDSLGVVGWTTLAEQAGVADLGAFDLCMERPASDAISIGIATGREVGIRGTPAVLVDGMLLSRPPTLADLEGITQQIIDRG